MLNVHSSRSSSSAHGISSQSTASKESSKGIVPNRDETDSFAVLGLGISAHSQGAPPQPSGLQKPGTLAQKALNPGIRDHDNYMKYAFAPIDLNRLSQSVTELPKWVGSKASSGKVKYGALQSNEQIGRLFPAEFLKRHTGHGYLGVGTDQNYTLMGGARSDRAWLIDINPEVAKFHQLSSIAFMYGENGTEYVSFFAKNNREVIAGFLKSNFPHLETLYSKVASSVFRNFHGKIIGSDIEVEYKSGERVVASGFVGAGQPTFLHPNRTEDYAHVRNLFRAGKVAVLQGNIFKDDVLRRVGDLARVEDESIGMTYVSNAISKRYGDLHSKTLIDGINDLPRNKDSVLLNTWMDVPETYGIPVMEYEAFKVHCCGFWTWEPNAVPFSVFSKYAKEKPSLPTRLWNYFMGDAEPALTVATAL